MRQFFVIIALILAIGWGEAVADLTPVADELYTYEIQPEKLAIPNLSDAAQSGAIEAIYHEYESSNVQKALEILITSVLESPELHDLAVFRLLEAELYFLLGKKDAKVQYEVAKPIFQDIFYRYPESANESLIAFRLATILKRMAFFPESEGYYRLLMEKYPKSEYAREARLGLAYCHFAQDHFKESLELLSQIKSDADYQSVWPFALAMEATIRYRENKTPQALSLFQEAFSKGLTLHDLTAEGLFYYAETLFINNYQKQGYDLHCNLIQRKDAGEYLAGALLRIADYEISIHETDKAVARYQLLFKKFPDTEPGYLAAIRLGDLRARSHPDDLDEQVIRSYRAVADSLASNSILNLARHRLSSYYLAGDAFEESARISSDLLRSNPTTQLEQLAKRTLREAFSGYLVQAIAQKRFGAACHVFRQHRTEILSTGLDEQLVEQIFQVHEQQLLWDTVLSIADERTIKERFMDLGRYYAGLAMMAKGEEKQGAKLLILAANHGDMPERSLALLRLADLQGKKGDINGAMTTLKQVLTLKNLPPAIRAETSILLADLQMMLGEYKAAEELLSEATKIIEPGAGIGDAELFSDAIFGLADVTYRLGKNAESMTYYQAAIGGFPEDVRLPLARMRLRKLQEKPSDPAGSLPVIQDRFWSEIVEKMDAQEQWRKTNLASKG